ncbi:hypothetical protein HNQ91_003194 [Filimonas zeae]|uniref:Uncharacterized protein n=1 Tax=Filimonas zeae TaxID=1737353 RepID=A0A917J156_9BACT|nr:hypothetical protein [Filimonas zeae]MDR6340129.1 hypothetical protein [Filimonas zeae]GGH71282.1 hypothetical protein GCM10011379_30460 [Filimonas zeae]
MKIDTLPHSAQPPYAERSNALPNLFLMLSYQLPPEKVPNLKSTGQFEAWVTDIEAHCNSFTIELLTFSYSEADTSVKHSLQKSWCAVNALLDIVWNYIKKHPELKADYQPILNAFIQVYDYLDTHFKHLYPAGSKMPDIIIHKNIPVMRSGYQNLMKAHNNNGLLQALLHPVWEVIKHPGKGNNTFHRVTYAFQLLGRVKLWHQAKGTYEQLYNIALCMNTNCPAFLQYLSGMGKNELELYGDARSKQNFLDSWHARHREALWLCKQSKLQEGYNAEEQHVAVWLTNWLQEQKEFLELAKNQMDEKERLKLAHDLAFLCWHTKIQVKVGFYTSPFVQPVITALADIICTENASIPSFQSLERLIKCTEIPYETKDELAEYYSSSLKELFKVPEKGVRPKIVKVKAKRTNKPKPKTNAPAKK